MADVWRAIGNDVMFFACLERCLELAPDRTDMRFDLAFRYDATGFGPHALYHYEELVKFKDQIPGWNNLGVVAGTLKLPVTAIDAYQVAANAGNSLAISNIASLKLDAGFLDEAVESCKTGLTDKEAHPRLSEVFASCQRAREKEQASKEEHLKSTTRRRNFLRLVGNASIQQMPQTRLTRWRINKCELIGIIDASGFELTGSYRERKYSGLGSLLGGEPADSSPMIEKFVTYSGRCYGRALVGRVKTSGDGSLLGEGNGIEVVGYLRKDSSAIEILEGSDSCYPITSVS
jgi:tetratricopeptide (TPR) repeat protein